MVGRSTDEDGSTIHVVRLGEEPVEIYRHRESAGVGDLSHDGSLIAVEHTEHGDAMHSALRVLRPDGSTVTELDDTKGGTVELGLEVLGFAPVDGDSRLLIGHQRRGRWEPLVWDVATGEETDLALDLPGDVAAEWYPDGSALLIAHSFEARSDLWRYDLASRELVQVPTRRAPSPGRRPAPTEPSTCGPRRPSRPWSARRRARSSSIPGLKSPGSVPVEDVSVEGPGGRVHALIQKPAGTTGPRPPSSTSTAARPGTTATPSRRARRPGWTTGTRWSRSTTEAPRATAASWTEHPGAPGRPDRARTSRRSGNGR